MTYVESWLDEREHSLLPLSNPGSDPEVCLENSEMEPCWEGRAMSLGHWSRGTITLPFPAALSLLALTLPATLSFPATALLPHRDAALHQSQRVAVALPIYGLGV